MNSFPKNEQLPQKLRPVYPNILRWCHEAKANIKEIKNKLITTKNIYHTTVNSLTKTYLLANQA